MRLAAQRDTNEREVIDALEAIGCSVQALNHRGVPDLLVGFRGRTHLLEVKQPEPPRTKRATKPVHGLTEDQRQWHSAWRGDAPWIVRSGAQAVSVVVGDAEREG